MEPSYEAIFRRKMTAVTHSIATMQKNKIRLEWENPKTSDINAIVIVRKENEKPISVTDGKEVYRGLEEVFSDDVQNNSETYFYAIFVESKDGSYGEPVYKFVDTYTYSLYGTVTDMNGNTVENIDVALKDRNGNVVTALTDKRGHFSINDLIDGNYSVQFNSSAYTFGNVIQSNVVIKGESIEMGVTAIGKPVLAIDMDSVANVGKKISIGWNGLHIENNALINIKIFRKNQWKTIVSGLEFSAHRFVWSVGKPEDTNATVRIELAAEPGIFFEKEFSVLKGDSLEYDFNKNGIIDIDDIMEVAKIWSSHQGDGIYDPLYDLNGDGEINIIDIMIVSSDWGLQL